MLDTRFVRENRGFTNVGYLSAYELKKLLLDSVDRLLTSESEGIETGDYIINHEVNKLLQGIEIIREKVNSENKTKPGRKPHH
jgi:hypothetical protein